MEILDTASSLENTVSFSEAEVNVVKAALKTKLFVQTEPLEVRTAKFAALVTALAEAFGVPQLNLKVEAHQQPGYCGFDGETNSVLINQRFSLTNTLVGFAAAMVHHKPELMPRPTSMEEAGALMSAGHFNPMAFALSMFKEAAPRMFESAKMAGRLVGTNVEYTDGGRLTAERHAEQERIDDEGDDSVTDDNHPTPPPTQRPAPRAQNPAADIDPENRRDRGNGLGED